DQLGQFVVADQRVDGDEDAAGRGEAVGVGGDLVQLLDGEVLGLGAGGELLEAEVNRVGAEVEGGVCGLGSAGRRQQFGGAGARSGADGGQLKRLGRGAVLALRLDRLRR